MDMQQLTKITLAWELYEQGVPKSHIAEKLGIHRETIHQWVTGIVQQEEGLLGFLNDYIHAKKGPRKKRKVDGLLKARIYQLREDNRDCCGQKIQKYLHDDYGVWLSLRGIYKILGEKYVLRSKWKKNQRRGPIPQAERPREVIQMDTIDFGMVFAFTGIDIFAKDACVKLYPSLTSYEGADFLTYAFEKRFNHTDLLQADGGPEFKDQFKKKVFLYTHRFRVARPYRKNEQSYIESFNRSVRKECLGWGTYYPKDIPILEKEVREYLVYYHTKRPHLSLHMKTPNQVLEDYRVSDI